jgi:2-dehydro-3-deoxygalactonokinase
MAETTGRFLSCDWGTTSFRLRLVSCQDCEIISEVREKTGIKAIYEEASRCGANTQEARREFFARFLREKIDLLLSRQSSPNTPLPLVISGMASSSVGWRELPYAKTPFRLNGADIVAEELQWTAPPQVNRTWLISGVANDYNIMRGEESEIIGLMADPELAAYQRRSLLILPGTHSKHVLVQEGSIVDFHTHITGELFEVLGRHSLLRASLDLDQEKPGGKPSGAKLNAFQEGVLWARDHGLSGALFRVRTRAVLGGCLPNENTWFFSGLLIGAELTEVANNAGAVTIILAAGSGLSDLYALALQVLQGSTQWLQIPPKQVERAVVRAHALFLKRRLASI